jgi:hypothetical protein
MTFSFQMASGLLKIETDVFRSRQTWINSIAKSPEWSYSLFA